MSEVIAIRVSEELKKELERIDPDELRAYLEKIAKRRKLDRAMEEVRKHREKLAKKYGSTGSSVGTIRWDREHGH